MAINGRPETPRTVLKSTGLVAGPAIGGAEAMTVLDDATKALRLLGDPPHLPHTIEYMVVVVHCGP